MTRPRMFDTSQNLIVINGCIRIAQIERCQYEASNKYYIVFAGSPKGYAYRADKVLWIKIPSRSIRRIIGWSTTAVS